jgi:hypothetical protein
MTRLKRRQESKRQQCVACGKFRASNCDNMNQTSGHVPDLPDQRGRIAVSASRTRRVYHSSRKEKCEPVHTTKAPHAPESLCAPKSDSFRVL